MYTRTYASMRARGLAHCSLNRPRLRLRAPLTDNYVGVRLGLLPDGRELLRFDVQSDGREGGLG